MTITELRKAIRIAAVRLTGNGPSKGTSNLRKAELEALLAEYTERLDKARAVNGAYEQEAARVHGLRYDEDTETWVPFGPGARQATTDEGTQTGVDRHLADLEAEGVTDKGTPAEEALLDDEHGDIAAPDGLGQRDPNEGIDEWHAFMDEQATAVNEGVRGDEVMRRWLELDEQNRTETLDEMAARLAVVPSPLREYQSTQEALAVLLVEDDRDEANPEFAAEVDALVAKDLAADVPPARMVERVQAAAQFPITETDVAQAQVDVVVQLKSRLYIGKLVAVVNRRTKFAQPVLATVEVGGVRFLVNTDDVLAA